MMSQSEPPEAESPKETDDVSASLEEAGASLPNPEEIRTDVAPRKMPSKRWKWYCAIFTLFVAFIVVVSLSAAAITSSKNYTVVDCLTEHGISDPESMTTEGTPQYEAVKWMVEKDRTKVPHKTSSDLERTHFINRYVMAVLYYSMGGPTWFYQLNWLSSVDICQWQELDRVNKPGIYCLRDGSPYYVVLSGNNLMGSIPSEIGLLTSLNKLNLKKNYDLGGKIPTELCQLKALETLELNDNSHIGSIPECFGKLGELTTLSLSNNDLTGSLPERLSGAKSLTMLYLDDNMLDGSPLNVVNSLTNLYRLFLSGNLFTGNINGDFLKKHDKLAVLDMSHNEFASTEFPSQLLELPSLGILDISQNRLGGTFPAEIQPNMNLAALSAYNNTFVGTLPSTISNLQNLQLLDLSANPLGGSMPDTLGDLNQIRTLFLADIPFTPGVIPESIASLPFLLEFSLRNTSRTGNMPVFSKANFQLYLLDLSSNKLTGSIPEEYGNITRLFFLLLNDNPELGGEIPPSFGNLPFLENGFFDGTNLEGDFSALCNIKETNFTSKRVFYADCGSPAKVNCTCCECCPSDVPGGCSKPAAANLNLEWEDGFSRRNRPDFDNPGLDP